jgi:hypothetical protein
MINGDEMNTIPPENITRDKKIPAIDEKRVKKVYFSNIFWERSFYHRWFSKPC